MGILDAVERFVMRRKEKPAGLREIRGELKGKEQLSQFNTPVVGSEYSNPDGTERQDALAKLKVGEKIRLIWDSGESGNKMIIYVVRGGKGKALTMADCFGRLGDKTAADVIRWLTEENVVTLAKVLKITGGTRKRPKLGCVLELTTYPGPKEKA